MMPQPDDDTADRPPPPASGRRVRRRLSGCAVKVLVLGTGVIGVTARLRAGRRRPRGDGGRPPAGAGARDQLRQCRRGLAGLLGAVGRARRAAEGDQVAADAPPAAGDPAAHRPGHDRAGSLAMLRNCTAARYEINKARMVRLAEYSRDCLRALRADDRHRLRRAHAGHAAAVPHAEAARRQRRRHRGAARERRRLRAARPRRLHPPRAGARRGAATSSSAACCLPGDETGDCFKFTQAPGRARRRARRRRSASARRIARPGPQRQAHRRRRHRRRHARAPTPTWSRSAATRRCCSRRSASASRSIRSRATRSRCRSPTPAGAPESTVMDETHKVAVTRLGDRIRVGGTAELAGYTLKLHEARRADAGARRQRPVPARRRHRRGPSSGAACGR